MTTSVENRANPRLHPAGVQTLLFLPRNAANRFALLVVIAADQQFDMRTSVHMAIIGFEDQHQFGNFQFRLAWKIREQTSPELEIEHAIPLAATRRIAEKLPFIGKIAAHVEEAPAVAR